MLKRERLLGPGDHWEAEGGVPEGTGADGGLAVRGRRGAAGRSLQVSPPAVSASSLLTLTPGPCLMSSRCCKGHRGCGVP